MEAGARTLRPSARALDRTAAGAVPVDHAHGPGGGGRVLDLHLGAGRAAGAAALGRARARSRASAPRPRSGSSRSTCRARAGSTRTRRARSARGPASSPPGSSSASSRSSRRSSTSSSAGRCTTSSTRASAGTGAASGSCGCCSMAAIVFLLTYRDVRISTTAGVHPRRVRDRDLRRARDLDPLLEARRPEHAAVQPDHAAGDWSGVFKGMVFAILAFIGFEASAPLGEEAKNPRRTVPRAVVGSALAIGIFYVLCSYAWVFGAGFDNFVDAGDRSRPVAEPRQGVLGHRLGRRLPRDLQLDRGELERGDERGDARVLRARAQRPRAGAARRARTRSSRRRTSRSSGSAASRVVISLLVGWKWNPGVGFGIIATVAVPLVVVVYMLVCVGCIAYYLRVRRSEFNPLLHVVLPIGGIVLFFFPLYYQFVKVPPPYPFKYANWVAIVYTILGVVVTIARREVPAGPARRPRPRLRRGRIDDTTGCRSSNFLSRDQVIWSFGPDLQPGARGRAGRHGHVRDERLLHGPDPKRERPRHRDRPLAHQQRDRAGRGAGRRAGRLARSSRSSTCARSSGASRRSSPASAS